MNVNGDEFPNDDSQPEGFTTKDADLLAASGFNFVRLAISWNKLVPIRPSDPNNFQVNQDALAKVVRVTNLLASRHIYFMLDFHQGCFDRWPAWAIPYDQGVGQGTADQSFPHCQLVPSGTTRAADNLFKDPVDPDNALLPGGSTAVIPVNQVWSAYREAWKRVGEQYRNTDYLMGYNFINEPMTSHINECNDPAVGCPLAEEKIQAFE
jgi:hypothetical protein